MTLFELLLIYGAAALGFSSWVDGVGYLIANTGGRGASRAQRRLLGDRPEARPRSASRRWRATTR